MDGSRLPGLSCSLERCTSWRRQAYQLLAVFLLTGSLHSSAITGILSNALAVYSLTGSLKGSVITGILSSALAVYSLTGSLKGSAITGTLTSCVPAGKLIIALAISFIPGLLTWRVAQRARNRLADRKLDWAALALGGMAAFAHPPRKKGGPCPPERVLPNSA